MFTLDKESKISRDSEADNKNENDSIISSRTEINNAVLRILPDLWEQQQYDDEYNMDSFLSSLKNTQ